MRKGQITVFIILGLIILFVVGLVSYFTFRQPKSVRSLDIPSNLQSLALEEIESCLAQTSRAAVYKVAAGAGHINAISALKYGDSGDNNPSHFFTDIAAVPYVVNKGKVNFQSYNDMITLVNNYIAVELPGCLSFDNLKSQGFKITQPNISWQNYNFEFERAMLEYSSTQLSFDTLTTPAGELLISISYPILFESPKESFTLNSASVTLPLRLKMLYNIAGDLANRAADSALQIDPINRAAMPTFYLGSVCNLIDSSSDSINVYSTNNEKRMAHVIQVVDAFPTKFGLAPLKFQFALRNVVVSGACVK